LSQGFHHDTINHPCLNEAKMSLQHAAKHLAAHGRGPDTVLVHMSKGEVKSLNDLAMAHGGHLTINPKTGLPEAGFLSSILPMALGFGLNMAFPGLGQVGSGLITGALGMALNPKGGLMGGLMAGLGGYGGAGLGQSLAAAGMQEATAAELAQNQAYQQAQATAQEQALQLGANPTTATGIANIPLTPDQYAAQAQSITAPLNQMSQATADRIAVNSGFGDPSLTTSTMGNRMGTAFEGFKSLGGESGRDAFMNNIGGLSGLAKTGAMAAAPLLADAMKEDAPPEIKTDSDPGQQYKYAANPSNPTPASDRYGREQTYFNPTYTNAAAGGMMASGGMALGGLSSNAGPLLERLMGKSSGDQPGVPEGYSYDPDTQQYIKLASGGISDAYNLGGYSDGGRLLRGPGDGVSDSIPAVIGKKQPARLADGEFVVPARIVSELGNGSTEAGARKLYAMMDRIQKTRSKTVGKGKIAKNSRAEQYLPA
jgi:hypothetical protein